MDGRDYLVINARDVSAAERTRLEREAILDNASIGIAFTRDRLFVQANPRFEQMFGWADRRAGRPVRVAWSGSSDEDYAEIGRKLGPAAARGGARSSSNAPMRRRDGSQFWCRMLAQGGRSDAARATAARSGSPKT